MKRERAPATQRRRMAYLLPPPLARNAIDLARPNLANAAYVQH
jgi:hypothetical protein